MRRRTQGPAWELWPARAEKRAKGHRTGGVRRRAPPFLKSGDGARDSSKQAAAAAGGRAGGRAKCCSTLQLRAAAAAGCLGDSLAPSQAGVEVERFERAAPRQRAVRRTVACYRTPSLLPTITACSHNSIFHLHKRGHSLSRLVPIKHSLAFVSYPPSKTFAAAFIYFQRSIRLASLQSLLSLFECYSKDCSPINTATPYTS
ncbi:hypothetical protein L1887_51502 [Cichorium endivia]|nr:hypothetical protein L1887_51502 [Cichorium endivia]